MMEEENSVKGRGEAKRKLGNNGSSFPLHSENYLKPLALYPAGQP